MGTAYKHISGYLAAFFALLALACAFTFPAHAFAEDTVTVPVAIEGSPTKATVVVEPVDGAAAPTQTSVQIDGAGEIVLPLVAGEAALKNEYNVWLQEAYPEGGGANAHIVVGEDGSTTTYDTTKWLVQVYTEPSPNGLLKAVITSAQGSDYKPGEIKFTNTFTTPTPDPDDPNPCTVSPPLRKVLSGDTPAVAGTFTFVFKAVSNTADYEVADMPMPDGAQDGSVSKTVKGPGSYEFSSFQIERAGTYVYSMEEENTGEGGYTYDTVRYTITWTVEEQDGSLVAALSIADASGNRVNTCEFTNTYTAPPVDPDDPEPCIIDPPLKKLVTGDTPANAGTFKFIMKAISNTAGYDVAAMPMPEGSEDGVKRKTVIGPGEYEFGNYPITRAGTYVYSMEEENAGEDGYTYDTVRYTLTWTVVEQDGKLVPSVVIHDQDGKRVETCEFTNVYEEPVAPPDNPEPCIIDPPLKKLVTGDTPAKKGTFKFIMKAISNTAGYKVADMPMPEGSEDGIKRKTVEGPGEYEFGNYQITRAGTYVYSMEEENVGEDGYTYDTVRYTLTWTVAEQNGKLVPSVIITDQDGKRVNTCEFTNVYSASKTPQPSSTPTPTPPTTTRTSSPSPITGDNAPIVILALIAVVSLAAAYSSRKRSHKG